jgi:ABC-type polysaccharide/polyol phosphate export permease
MKPSKEDLLLEEYQNAYEHIRYVEAKRDRYVPGIIAASGVVLALLANIFAGNDQTSIIVFIIIILLCLSLGTLSCFLYRAYDSLSDVIRHYEGVIKFVRSIIYDLDIKRLVKIDDEEKTLISWVDIRKNPLIRRRPAKISKLSLCILRWLFILWFVAAGVFVVYIFCGGCVIS